MKASKIIIVPETHWDREWYLPFNEFRARLVIMMDKLLEIYKTNPDYKNFTLDGQTIPLEDYLEVRPNREEEIKKYVKERRLSIGPFYILPDEFLVSGESIVRNLLLGHDIAKKFGRVMKAGYIPDTFGHIAQYPQIVSQFELPSAIFWRGFGDEFERDNLNMEFTWNAPGNAASTLGIHLIYSYGSLADLITKRTKEGVFKPALRKIKGMVAAFEKYTATPIVLLNSGSDHHEARPEIPEIVKQWNQENPDQMLEQNDFEYYTDQVLKAKPNLKSYQGELRGGRFAHLLSGVFSARMWIKQRNTAIESLYEKYAEPLSTIAWALDSKYKKFEYPASYLCRGYKWLMQNHPHDSICGCSIDQVHDEMRTRFDWAEQIGNEVMKDSWLYLTDLIKTDTHGDKRYACIVFNPLPWRRKDVVSFHCATLAKGQKEKFLTDLKIIDANGNEIEFQNHYVEEDSRYVQELNLSHRFTIIADIPACGYRVFYVVPKEKPKEFPLETAEFKSSEASLENEFYSIKVKKDGAIEVLDKINGVSYENVCQFEDVGDWGDEYDFSGPKQNQTESKFTTKDAENIEISSFVNGPSQKTVCVKMNLKLPTCLSMDRLKRDPTLVDNEILLYISLYKGIKRIDFRIELKNVSKDHRIRVLFPTNIKTDTVHADGHFYVVPRSVEMPKGEKWVQAPQPTNHQKGFVAACEGKMCIAVLNKGLPEYEAIRNADGTISFAITLLRCMEWLSRGDFSTRKSDAGPSINVPEAQCLGSHTFDLSFVSANKQSTAWTDSEIQLRAQEFNNPFKVIFPFVTNTPLRILDKLVLTPLGVLAYFIKPHQSIGEPYLPSELSFLEIDNKNIVLSALKKADKDNCLVVRSYNVSSQKQTAIFKFGALEKIESVKIVNCLEEAPTNKIKAQACLVASNAVELSIDPHVIATLKLDFKIK